MPIAITPYQPADKTALIDLSLAAWAPVFAQRAAAVPPFVYANFYPNGWEARQRTDLSAVLDNESGRVRVARLNGQTVGGWDTACIPKTAWGRSTYWPLPLHNSGVASAQH